MLGSIIGGSAGSAVKQPKMKAKSKKGGPARPSGKLASTPQKTPVASSSLRQAPRTSTPPSSSRKKTDNDLQGSRKTSELDVDAYLDKEGKAALDEKLSITLLRFDAPPFSETLTFSSQLKAMQPELTKVVVELREMHTSAINMYWKVAKRAQPPGDAVERLQLLRDRISAVWTLISQLQAKSLLDLNAERLLEAIVIAETKSSPVPFAARSLQFCVQSQEFVRFSRFDDLGGLIADGKVAGFSVCASKKLVLNIGVVEEALVSFWKDVQGTHTSFQADMSLIVKSAVLLQAILKAEVRSSGCICDSAAGWATQQAVATIVTAVGRDDDATQEDLEDAHEALSQATSASIGALGIYKALIGSGSKDSMLGVLSIRNAQKRKLLGKVQSLTQLAKLVEKFKTTSEMITEVDGEAFDKAFETAMTYIEEQPPEKIEGARTEVSRIMSLAADVSQEECTRLYSIMPMVLTRLRSLSEGPEHVDFEKDEDIKALVAVVTQIVMKVGIVRGGNRGAECLGDFFEPWCKRVSRTKTNVKLGEQIMNDMLKVAMHIVKIKSADAGSPATVAKLKDMIVTHGQMMNVLGQVSFDDARDVATKTLQTFKETFDVSTAALPLYAEAKASYCAALEMLIEHCCAHSEAITSSGFGKKAAELVDHIKLQRHRAMQLVSWSTDAEVDNLLFSSVGDQVCDVFTSIAFCATLQKHAATSTKDKCVPSDVVFANASDKTFCSGLASLCGNEKVVTVLKKAISSEAEVDKFFKVVNNLLSEVTCGVTGRRRDRMCVHVAVDVVA